MSKCFMFALLLLCSMFVYAEGEYQKVSTGPSNLATVSKQFGVRVSCLTSFIELDEDTTPNCTKKETKILLANCTEPSPTTLRCTSKNRKVRLTFSSGGKVIWIAEK